MNKWSIKSQLFIFFEIILSPMKMTKDQMHTIFNHKYHFPSKFRPIPRLGPCLPPETTRCDPDVGAS